MPRTQAYLGPVLTQLSTDPQSGCCRKNIDPVLRSGSGSAYPRTYLWPGAAQLSKLCLCQAAVKPLHHAGRRRRGWRRFRGSIPPSLPLLLLLLLLPSSRCLLRLQLHLEPREAAQEEAVDLSRQLRDLMGSREGRGG